MTQTGTIASTETRIGASADKETITQTPRKERRAFKDVVPQQGLQENRVMSNGPVLDDLMKYRVRCVIVLKKVFVMFKTLFSASFFLQRTSDGMSSD
jgi:hypothetical protein